MRFLVVLSCLLAVCLARPQEDRNRAIIESVVESLPSFSNNPVPLVSELAKTVLESSGNPRFRSGNNQDIVLDAVLRAIGTVAEEANDEPSFRSGFDNSDFSGFTLPKIIIE